MGLLDWGFYFLEVTGNKIFEIYDFLVHPAPLQQFLGKRKVLFDTTFIFNGNYSETHTWEGSISKVEAKTRGAKCSSSFKGWSRKIGG